MTLAIRFAGGLGGPFQVACFELRFAEPATAFALSLIRYFVGLATPPELGGAPQPLDLVSPPDLASLTPDTRFAWRPVDGAAAYQLEILWRSEAVAEASRPEAALEPNAQRTLLLSDETAQPERITGAIVPKQPTELVLSPAVLQRLAAGRRYSWRLLALAEDGTVLAKSQPREIRVPPRSRSPPGARCRSHDVQLLSI